MQLLKGQSPINLTTVILFIEISLIILFLSRFVPFFYDYQLGVIAIIGLLICYGILYPLAVLLERKHQLVKDLVLFLLGFLSLALMLGHPIVKVFGLGALTAIGYVLAFLTLFYNLYVWHRVGNKRPIATRLAFILWPRQMFFIGKIIVLGIPL